MEIILPCYLTKSLPERASRKHDWGLERDQPWRATIIFIGSRTAVCFEPSRRTLVPAGAPGIDSVTPNPGSCGSALLHAALVRTTCRDDAGGGRLAANAANGRTRGLHWRRSVVAAFIARAACQLSRNRVSKLSSSAVRAILKTRVRHLFGTKTRPRNGRSNH